VAEITFVNKPSHVFRTRSICNCCRWAKK